VAVSVKYQINQSAAVRIVHGVQGTKKTTAASNVL
jgi:hypothetical protein